jgi:glycosyltransferase involved in cell wall biosynthesis
MKAQFFLLDGDTNASSRHRVLQYLPLLRAHGIDGLAVRPVPAALSARLVERGPMTARQKIVYYGTFAALRFAAVLAAHRADVVVIQRDLFPFGPPLLERLLFRRNAHLVYDTDDATYLRPSFTPDTPFQRLRAWNKPAEVASHARWVSAATAPIANWARQYASDVSVVPMAVDGSEYTPVVPSHKDRPVLGWAGTPGGLRYLESLAPVLRDLARTDDFLVRVISGGYRNVRLPGVPVEARPWRGATAIADLRTFDIGLVPLDDSPFERAKFPFKLLQYMALGLPSVSAGLGEATHVVQHGRNGLLAGNAEEWRAHLSRLLRDPSLRATLGAGARETVEQHYTIERVGPALVEGLYRAAG